MVTLTLFDKRGNRKYLIARERLAFVYAASKEPDAIATFCLTLEFTGARISELLALNDKPNLCWQRSNNFRDAQAAEEADFPCHTRGCKAPCTFLSKSTIATFIWTKLRRFSRVQNGTADMWACGWR